MMTWDGVVMLVGITLLFWGAFSRGAPQTSAFACGLGLGLTLIGFFGL